MEHVSYFATLSAFNNTLPLHFHADEEDNSLIMCDKKIQFKFVLTNGLSGKDNSIIYSINDLSARKDSTPYGIGVVLFRYRKIALKEQEEILKGDVSCFKMGKDNVIINRIVCDNIQLSGLGRIATKTNENLSEAAFMIYLTEHDSTNILGTALLTFEKY